MSLWGWYVYYLYVLSVRVFVRVEIVNYNCLNLYATVASVLIPGEREEGEGERERGGERGKRGGEGEGLIPGKDRAGS